jgi:hypothetical protein
MVTNRQPRIQFSTTRAVNCALTRPRESRSVSLVQPINAQHYSKKAPSLSMNQSMYQLINQLGSNSESQSINRPINQNVISALWDRTITNHTHFLDLDGQNIETTHPLPHFRTTLLQDPGPRISKHPNGRNGNDSFRQSFIRKSKMRFFRMKGDEE